MWLEVSEELSGPPRAMYRGARLVPTANDVAEQRAYPCRNEHGLEWIFCDAIHHLLACSLDAFASLFHQFMPRFTSVVDGFTAFLLGGAQGIASACQCSTSEFSNVLDDLAGVFC